MNPLSTWSIELQHSYDRLLCKTKFSTPPRNCISEKPNSNQRVLRVRSVNAPKSVHTACLKGQYDLLTGSHFCTKCIKLLSIQQGMANDPYYTAHAALRNTLFFLNMGGGVWKCKHASQGIQSIDPPTTMRVLPYTDNYSLNEALRNLVRLKNIFFKSQWIR